VAERLITKAKRLGEVAYTPQEKLSAKDKARRLHVARLVGAYIPRFGVRTEKGGEQKKVDLVEKVMLDLAKRFANRAGGYTRIIKFGPRRGDNAPMSLVELLGADEEASSDEGEKKPKAKTSAKSKSKKATAAAPKEGVKAE
jgi:large subunit ribosomal protein L17